MKAEQKAPDIESKLSRIEGMITNGDIQQAKNICEDILSEFPNNLSALDSQANIYESTEEIDLAIGIRENIYHIGKGNAWACYRLGSLYYKNMEGLKAMDMMRQAVLNDPSKTKYKIDFAKTIRHLIFKKPGPKTKEIKEAIQICLEDENVSHRLLARVWQSIFTTSDDFIWLMELTRNTDIYTAPQIIDKKRLVKTLNDTFLLLALRRLIITDYRYEWIMLFLRKHFLFSDDYDAADLLPFLCALAEQCSLNEYVYAYSEEEQRKIIALKNEIKIAANEPVNALTIAKIALIGCYQELSTLDDATEISKAAKKSDDDNFKNLVNVQIDQPQEVKALHSSIVSLSPINNDISEAVRKQYEESPFPRWRCLSIPPYSTIERQIAGRGKDILIAGCGTGQQLLGMAVAFPESRMLGIDLSIASLAYSKQKAIELGINNVEIMHADILELEKLDRKFDLIACCGVLHHMEDPVKGWNTLLNCLKPDGIMEIGLYSEMARQNIAVARNWIKEQGIKPSAGGIREFRQIIMQMNNQLPIKQIAALADFYTLSTCRDLAFHVQEHRFTIPQLKIILEDMDLEFLGFSFMQKKIKPNYKKRFTDDPQALNIDNWHILEQQNPSIFIEMYDIWCQRKESNNPALIPDWISQNIAT